MTHDKIITAQLPKAEVWRLAAQVEDQSPEEAFDMRFNWLCDAHLKGSDRLSRDDVFYDILYRCFFAPMLDDVTGPSGRHDKEIQVDALYKQLIHLSRNLHHAIPHSEDTYSLVGLMEARLPVGPAGDQARDYLINLQRVLRQIVAAPLLRKRPSRTRPAYIKDGFVRRLARAMCWYMLRFEHKKPTISEAGKGRPTCRAGVLTAIALEALNLKGHSSIIHHLREVMKDPSWRDPAFDLWDNLPTSRPIR